MNVRVDSWNTLQPRHGWWNDYEPALWHCTSEGISLL